VRCAGSPAWWLYNLLFPAVFAALLPKFLLRMMRRGGWHHHFWERVGVLDRATRRRLQRRTRWRVWIHAVSVGEVYVAARFMAELRRRRQDVSFVLTTTTSTGRAVAEKHLSAEDIIFYLPLDRPWLMRRLLRLVQPALVLLVECEMWPNLLRYCTRYGIPVVLVNGRISDHSFRNYRRVRWMTRRLLPMMDLLCLQGDTDAARLLELGAPPERIVVVGSAKYDVDPGDDSTAETVGKVLERVGFDGRLLLVGGSTWPGEEAALVEAYRRLRGAHPDLRLVLVPRHVERAPEIEGLLAAAGLRYVLRSRVEESAGADDYDVLLADTTGELRGFYRWAQVVFVGKSLTRKGGQNIIEPARYGRPIITGPNLQNFRAVAEDFRRAGALLEVRNEEELVSVVRDLLADPGRREEYGRRARQVVEERRGAVQRTLDEIFRRLNVLKPEETGGADRATVGGTED